MRVIEVPPFALESGDTLASLMQNMRNEMMNAESDKFAADEMRKCAKHLVTATQLLDGGDAFKEGIEREEKSPGKKQRYCIRRVQWAQA